MASLNQERTRDNFITDESRTFKKPTQTVGRPETTDHDINDEYMRNPPQVALSAPTAYCPVHDHSSQNLPTNVDASQRREPGVKEGAYEEVPGQEGQFEDRSAEREGLGRAKPIDVQNVADTTVHSNM
jgi:hypothetical protein